MESTLHTSSEPVMAAEDFSCQSWTNDFQQNGKIKNDKNFSANGSKLSEYP
jgi:hypothetical protein